MPSLLVSTSEGSANYRLSLADGGELLAQAQPAAATGVIAVTATAPITSSGGAVPNIAITAATDAAAGSMSAADKTKLDGLSSTPVNAVTGTAPIVSSGGQTPAISITAATDAAAGSMSAADKTKLDVLGLSLANGAALTAQSTAGMLTGQVAYVQTFGALWSYQPASALTPDGSTVLAAAGGGNWLRGLSAITEAAAVQTAWYVDAQNTSGTASDENTGLAAGTALRTKAEIFRRWGTNSPNLNGIAVTITYLSSDTGLNDPGFFTPNFINGATLLHTAALPAAAFTGTLLSVTAKNVAGNQALTSTFTTLSGAIAANMILVNATRGNSRAVARRNQGANVWQLTQPLTPYVPGTFPAPTNVDTWANGDSVSGFVPISVNLPLIGGQVAQPNAAVLQPSHVVQQITFFSTGFENVCSFDLGCSPAAVDCVITNVWNVGGRSTGVQGLFVGVCLTAFGGVTGTSLFSFQMVGGQISGGSFDRFRFTNNVAVAASTLLFNSTAGVGQVYVDTGVTLTTLGSIQMGGTSAFYGAGLLNVQSGVLLYTSTAAASFPLSGGLQIAGQGNAYSNATAAGLTTTHLLTLTAAHLDAAAGAAGFGGLAYVPAVGAITNASTP
jgi:hypothetical protein